MQLNRCDNSKLMQDEWLEALETMYSQIGSEVDPHRDAYVGAWLDGYMSVASLGKNDLTVTTALVMLRRMLLIGWFSTHQHTQEAHELRNYVPASLEIAEQFLSGQYLKMT